MHKKTLLACATLACGLTWSTAGMAAEPELNIGVIVGDAYDIGWVDSAYGSGRRRVVPILGGTAQCTHPAGAWQARIVPAGADFQLFSQENVACLNARYILETEAGELVYVENTALRKGPPELITRMLSGQAVDASQIYFRCQPRFETHSGRLRWLNDTLFLGTGSRQPESVHLEVHAVD